MTATTPTGLDQAAAAYEAMIETVTLREVVAHAESEDAYCCQHGCGTGACETCPCCCAGWCVMGADGLPEAPENLAHWLEVAAEHNPVAAALAAAAARVAEVEVAATPPGGVLVASDLRALAEGQRDGYARMLELNGGIGLLGVREPTLFAAMKAWAEATENEHADTVLTLLDEVDRLRLAAERPASGEALTTAAALVHEYIETGGEAYEIVRADRILQSLAAADAPAAAPDEREALDTGAIRRRASEYKPGDVLGGVRALLVHAPDQLGTGCVRYDRDHVRDAVRRVARVNFQDVPALCDEVDRLRATLAARPAPVVGGEAEWGTRLSDGSVEPGAEDECRYSAERDPDMYALVRRTVTPWTVADAPAADGEGGQEISPGADAFADLGLPLEDGAR